MADAKKILVVDDHFEMLEFLRSMLELSNQDYEVLAVPSAEEALLEVRHTPFDLLITDVRLPGMSGFDLVRRTKVFKPDLPSIIITAYSSAQGRKEAADLGVIRYFQKPLDTNDMLTAVHTALYGNRTQQSGRALEAEIVDIDLVLPRGVRRRLETLRADTGASALMLAAIGGQILHQVGENRAWITPDLANTIAQNLNGSFAMAEQLGREQAVTFQYHAGKEVEVYCANIGFDYVLALFFDAQTRRGRIGTIWVFVQRAIRDLLELLPVPEMLDETGERAQERSARPTGVPPAAKTDPAPAAEAPPPVNDVREETPAELPDQEDAQSETAVNAAVDATLEELEGLLTQEAAAADQGKDVDAFWDSALAEEGGSGLTSGFTLEEARRKGLIPDEIDFEDSAE